MTTKEFVKDIFNKPLLYCIVSGELCKFLEEDNNTLLCHSMKETILIDKFAYCPLMREE